MRKSRREFENQPDTGFFGKKCSRICNLIEVYFFRFIIAGLIISLILFPIAIIINSIISLVLAITAWLWVVLVLIIVYFLLFSIISSLFQIFIYDFDCPSSHSHYWRTIPCLPFFFELYRFLWSGIFQYLFALFCIFILHPFFAIFMLVFGHLRIALRSIYDCLSFQVNSIL